MCPACLRSIKPALSPKDCSRPVSMFKAQRVNEQKTKNGVRSSVPRGLSNQDYLRLSPACDALTVRRLPHQIFDSTLSTSSNTTSLLLHPTPTTCATQLPSNREATCFDHVSRATCQAKVPQGEAKRPAEAITTMGVIEWWELQDIERGLHPGTAKPHKKHLPGQGRLAAAAGEGDVCPCQA